MSEIKLKRCPFCGGEAVVCQDTDGYYVSCSNDDCVVMTYSGLKEEAIKQWNTRKPMQEIVKRLEEIKEPIPNDWGENVGSTIDFDKAIEIVKEVGGMNAEMEKSK